MKLPMSRKFQLLAVPLLFIGVFTYWVAANALKFNSTDLERALEIKSLSNRSIAFLHLQLGATKAIILKPDLLVDYSDLKIRAFDESIAIIARIKELSDDQEMTRLVSELETTYKDKLRPRDSAILEKLFDDTGSATQLYFSEEASKEFRDFELINKKIYELSEKNAIQAKERLESANRESLISIAISLGLGIFLTLLIMLSLIYKVTKRMLSVSDKISQGTTSLNSAKDSIQTVSGDLRVMAGDGKLKIASAVSSVTRINENEKKHAFETQRASVLTMEAKDEAQKGVYQVEDLSGNLEKLRNNSKAISEIVEIINGIAVQTNILSLNAAVEAARAGEHGRGFSVVASAVRDLALKSKDSSHRASQIVTEGFQCIKEIEASMSHTRTSFNEIASKVETLTTLIQGIADASQKQALDVDGIQQALAALDQFSGLMNALSSKLETQSSVLSEDFEIVDFSVLELSSMVRGA